MYENMTAELASLPTSDAETCTYEPQIVDLTVTDTEYVSIL